jgi:hypothetical protein
MIPESNLLLQVAADSALGILPGPKPFLWGFSMLKPLCGQKDSPEPVGSRVVERIHRLKIITVSVKAGRAVRKYRAVKSDGPNDLVFQSVKDGKPIRDNNILSRFIKPAARQIGQAWVNWRSLRTSHAVWLKLAGADVKDAQGQMRHSRGEYDARYLSAIRP